MKRALSVFSLFFLLLPLYGNLDQLYSDRLEKNLLYKQTLFKLEAAEIALHCYDRNYIPSLSVSTSFTPGTMGNHHLGMTNGEPDPYTIDAQLVFNNIFGSTIEFSLPYTWDSESGHRIGVPALAVSRKLFAESGADYLKVKAQVLENEYKIEEIKIETWIELTRDIFTTYCNTKSEILYSEYMVLLETAIKGLKNEKEQNDMKRKLYSIKKLYLKAQYERDITELADYSESGELKSLYTELEEIAAGWEQKANELPGPSAKVADAKVADARVEEAEDTMVTGVLKSKDIKAMELYLEAAKREAAFWFLPFLPNPTLYASLAYNYEESQFYWGLGLSVTIPLVDHGERNLASRQRKQGEVMAQLALDDKNDEHSHAIKTIRQELEIMKIDIDILELDREEAHDAFLEAGQLYEKEIINESDYKLKKLDYELAELALIGKKGSYYTKLLNLFAEYYTDIGGLFNEKDN